MQSIQPNKIKLLKSYTHFIKANLLDYEYLNCLLSLIKQIPEMINLNNCEICNYNNKDFGLLVI
jgi:hypothetical protein